MSKPFEVDRFIDTANILPGEVVELTRLARSRATNNDLWHWLKERGFDGSSDQVRRWRDKYYPDGEIAIAVNELVGQARGLSVADALTFLVAKGILTVDLATRRLQEVEFGDLSAKELYNGTPGWMRETRTAAAAAESLKMWQDFRLWALALIEETRHEARIALKETPHLIPVFEPILDSMREKFYARGTGK